MRRITFVLMSVVAFLSTSFAETITDGDITFKLKASRDGSLYKQGEKIEFVLEVKKNGEPVKDLNFSSRLSKDGFYPQISDIGTTDKNGRAIILSKGLNEPGVVRCNLWTRNPDTKKDVMIAAGAGVDVYSIKMSQDVPADFKSYWDKQKRILAKIPMNAKMTPVETDKKNVELFDIKTDTFKGYLTGYYARPKGAKPKSCPAIILPHGAGVRSSNIGGVVGFAENGLIALDYNAHGIPNGKPDEYYKNLANTTLKGYLSFGADNRDESFLRVLYLRTLRALDFLMAQPEWDGKILIASGTSQGGSQSIVAGALCDKVSLVVAKVPGMCDHTGLKLHRIGGGPQIIKFDKTGDYNKDMLRELPYVDVANFAAFVKCKTILTTGLRDNICPPTTVFAAYSNLKCEKIIIIDEEKNHSVSKATSEKCTKYMIEHLRAK